MFTIDNKSFIKNLTEQIFDRKLLHGNLEGVEDQNLILSYFYFTPVNNILMSYAEIFFLTTYMFDMTIVNHNLF